MPDAFISYRRIGSLSLAYLLQEMLKNNYNLECYLDVTHSSNVNIQFDDRLMRAIEDAPVFICLLNKDTLNSKPVLKEIRKAYELKKPCIPVFQEGYEIAEELEDAVLYLHKYDAVHILDARGLFIAESVEKIAGLIKTIQDNEPEPLPQNLSKPKPQRNKRLLPTLGIGSILLAFITIAIIIFNGLGEPENLLLTETVNAQSTQNSLDMTETAEAQSTANAQATIDTQSIIDITATAQAQVQLAIDGVDSNEEWIPYTRQFNTVFMVLVPKGCFRMGNNDGNTDEQPSYELCRNTYWIDQYEVSNRQFDQFEGQAEDVSRWTNPTQPRDTITWYEARDFCAVRGARLPTELEWEYAARGVDALTYPWGDEFVSTLSINAENSINETASITSYGIAASWVGAYHMIGNVSEWTNSLYRPYPFNASDGREDMDAEGNRVARGGSYTSIREQLSTVNRFSYDPNASVRTVGFRCARDFSPNDIQG